MKTPRRFLLLLAALLASGPTGLRAADAPVVPPPVVPPAVILAAPQSDEVVNPLDCEHLLATATRDLTQVNPAMDAQLQSFTNPFYPKLPPPPPDIVATPTEAAPVAAPRLSDADKLAQVAAALQASGTMGMNGVLVLVMENHPPLRAGDVIEVTFPDEDQPSRIVILSISEKSYTLKLNDTVLPVSLKPAASSPTPPKP